MTHPFLSCEITRYRRKAETQESDTKGECKEDELLSVLSDILGDLMLSSQESKAH